MQRPTTVLALGLLAATAWLATGPWASSKARSAAPDAVLASAFAHELADADVSWAVPPAHMWLSGLGGGPFGKVLTVGDRITIDGKNGTPQAIEVTGLEQVDGTSIGLPGVRFQLVTGRLTQGRSDKPVRFLFAIDPEADATPAQATRPADRVL